MDSSQNLEFDVEELERKPNPFSGSIVITYKLTVKPGNRLWFGNTCCQQLVFQVSVSR